MKKSKVVMPEWAINVFYVSTMFYIIFGESEEMRKFFRYPMFIFAVFYFFIYVNFKAKELSLKIRAYADRKYPDKKCEKK